MTEHAIAPQSVLECGAIRALIGHMTNPFASIPVPELERIIARNVPEFSELSDSDARTLGMVLIEWANR